MCWCAHLQVARESKVLYYFAITCLLRQVLTISQSKKQKKILISIKISKYTTYSGYIFFILFFGIYQTIFMRQTLAVCQETSDIEWVQKFQKLPFTLPQIQNS